MPTTLYDSLDDPITQCTFKDDVLQDLVHPVDYFKLLLPPEDLQDIRELTSLHLYGVQGKDTVSVYEFYKMIGVLFILDLYPFSVIDHAFGKRGSLYSSQAVSSSISLEEFRVLHNGIKMPDGNPMYLFNKIELAARKVSNPSSYLSLDEMLRKYMSQFKFKHRMPSKPAKEGLKWFLLCCSQLRVPFVFTFHDNQIEAKDGLSKIGTMVYEMINKFIDSENRSKEGLTVFLDN